jgi:integrase
VINQAGNLQHQIMLRLLFYTAVRVSELAAIKAEDVDVDACRFSSSWAKGRKDRYILFPDSFKLILKSLAANPQNLYLFESRQRTKYSTRRIEQIVTHYAQIQLISGHANKKSLEVYP